MTPRKLVIDAQVVSVKNTEGNGKELVLVNTATELVPARGIDFVPETIKQQGRKASKRFLTYFTDNIRNLNTRKAYHRNACQFFDWCELMGLEFSGIQSFHVSPTSSI